MELECEKTLETLIMKRIFIAAAVLAGCSKTPDYLKDGHYCKHWTETKMICMDTTVKNFTDTIVVNNQWLCDTTNIGQVERAPQRWWRKVCDQDGLLNHWELWIEQLKNQ